MAFLVLTKCSFFNEKNAGRLPYSSHNLSPLLSYNSSVLLLQIYDNCCRGYPAQRYGAFNVEMEYLMIYDTIDRPTKKPSFVGPGLNLHRNAILGPGRLKAGGNTEDRGSPIREATWRCPLFCNPLKWY